MAKKLDLESPDLLDGPAAERVPAPPPDVQSLGRAWLDHQTNIDKSQSAFHAAMRARKVTASRPIVLDGRRFFPGLKGKVKETKDFA